MVSYLWREKSLPELFNTAAENLKDQFNDNALQHCICYEHLKITDFFMTFICQSSAKVSWSKTNRNSAKNSGKSSSKTKVCE